MAERLRKIYRELRTAVNPFTGAGEVIEVSIPASTAAAFYERVRNTLDYQEDHLLRRNAIHRTLRRFLGAGAELSKAAQDVVRELVWAKYLPNKTVPLTLVDAVEKIIEKYEPLLASAERLAKREDAIAWVLDVVATEVEYTLAPPSHEEALASFMYEEMRQRLDWDKRFALTPEEKDLRLYIAIHKTLLKSNFAILRFRVLTLYYPDWAGIATPATRIQELAENLPRVIAQVEGDIVDPQTDRLARLLRRRAGIFRVLRDTLTKDREDAEELLDDPELLDSAVQEALKARTREFKKRLRRTVVRAVLFLFLTKMLLALLIELPYDLLIAQDASLYPLMVNILFPPVLLALLSLTISIPEKKNTEDYIAAIRALAVGADHPVLHLRVKREVRTGWSLIFDILYVVLFVVVYSFISVTLHRFGFHALSIALFLFFLSLVTFFGIRIRSSTRDIVASDARSGLLGTLFDIFMLPIARAGAWLSTKVAKINIFIYFFDFIIESPLKVAIDFVESWLTFVREKKEEV